MLYWLSRGVGKPVSLDADFEDLKISALPLAETATLICHNAGSGAAQNVFTLNLDHVVKMRKDAVFRRAYRRAGLITADGFPIVLAGRLQGKRVRAWGKTNESQLKNPKRHKKAGKESGNYDSMAA